MVKRWVRQLLSLAVSGSSHTLRHRPCALSRRDLENRFFVSLSIVAPRTFSVFARGWVGSLLLQESRGPEPLLGGRSVGLGRVGERKLSKGFACGVFFGRERDAVAPGSTPPARVGGICRGGGYRVAARGRVVFRLPFCSSRCASASCLCVVRARVCPFGSMNKRISVAIDRSLCAF